MTKVVLVVAAHADDEVLGCGGTIARHVADRDTVHVVFLADGVTSRSSATQHQLNERRMSARGAQVILGYQQAHFLDLPDNRLDSTALLETVKPLEEIVNVLRPDLVYTHHSGDLNIDHRIAHQAVLTACRPQGEYIAREIFAFEVMSSTEWAGYGSAAFIPDVYVDIGNYWPQKCQALQAYGNEMRSAPHSRSVEHLEVLAQHRGACVGLAKAEAFKLVRSIR